jgi:hypothetical protein
MKIRSQNLQKRSRPRLMLRKNNSSKILPSVNFRRLNFQSFGELSMNLSQYDFGSFQDD